MVDRIRGAEIPPSNRGKVLSVKGRAHLQVVGVRSIQKKIMPTDIFSDFIEWQWPVRARRQWQTGQLIASTCRLRQETISAQMNIAETRVLLRRWPATPVW